MNFEYLQEKTVELAELISQFSSELYDRGFTREETLYCIPSFIEVITLPEINYEYDNGDDLD